MTCQGLTWRCETEIQQWWILQMTPHKIFTCELTLTFLNFSIYRALILLWDKTWKIVAFLYRLKGFNTQNKLMSVHLSIFYMASFGESISASLKCYNRSFHGEWNSWFIMKDQNYFNHLSWSISLSHEWNATKKIVSITFRFFVMYRDTHWNAK